MESATVLTLPSSKWYSDKYATRLVDRYLSHVVDEEVFRFTCKDAILFPNIQEEADKCTMIILHCLNIETSLPDASTILVTSKVTRHRCISTTCMILQGHPLDSFVQHWYRQQKAPSECQQNRSEYGGRNLYSLNSHTLFYRL